MFSDNLIGKLSIIFLKKNNNKSMQSIIKQESKNNSGAAKEKQLLITEFNRELGVCTDSIISKGILKASPNKVARQRKLAAKRLDYTINEVIANTDTSSNEAKLRILDVVSKFDVPLKKYRNDKLYLLSDKEIYELLGRDAKEKLEIGKIVHKKSSISYKQLLQQMNSIKEKHGISYAEFALYRCWEMNDDELTQVARLEDSRKIMRKGRAPGAGQILSNKLLFNAKYKDMLGRKYWTNKENNSYEDFLAFIDGLDEVFVKALKATRGNGAQRISLVNKNSKELYNSFMNMDLVLVEECVNQHESVEEFLPGCVNTIRIVTFLADGNEDFIYAAMRFGYNGIVDNFHNNGMACAVNIETGIIESPAINFKGDIFEKHPISDKTFEGFQIPYWNEIIDLVKRAMHVSEDILYVGWDIAVGQNGPVLIEGNGFPDPVLIQAPLIINNQKERYRYLKYLAPTIREQPEDVTGKTDDPVRMKITAEGVGLTYQWQYSDNNGETWKKSKNQSSEYTSTILPTRNGRLVRCIVKDYGKDKVISETAKINCISN